jgi:hypothetical protein
MCTHGVPSFPDPSHGGGPPAHVPESAKLRALKFAQCMRSHGVPDFPDPTFPAGGGIAERRPSGVNPNSRTFQNAAKACGRPG